MVQVLFEDGQTNRMHEALKLFADTVKLHTFVRTEFILFLNKRDLFADKIRKVTYMHDRADIAYISSHSP
mgnify:CR=1 FL=1